jgi:anaerobic magnesium-protoporphyrin IX monomethyl ester cyclase
MAKKVLLISLNKEFENVKAGWPHLGLIDVGTALKKGGYEVLVVDYAFQLDAPPVRHFCEQFKPDIIGLSLYTSTWERYDKLLGELPHFTNAVIMVGGPHTSLNHDELAKDNRINYIITGEVEEKICAICQDARKTEKPEVIHCGYIDIKNLLPADFSIAYRYDQIIERGVQLSRGCPYKCSFCQIRIIASRKVRYREIDDCIMEIESQLKLMPHLQVVRVIDDCPSFRLDLFKDFIRKFIQHFPHLSINIQHLRADQIDEEAADLLKKAHIQSVTIGVESANPVVYEHVQKAETLDEIEKACRLVKKKGIRLYLAFIVGLPLSNYEREKDSLDFAKKIKPYTVYWNMLIPYKGSRAWEWFQENGRVFTEKTGTTLTDSNLRFDRPSAETDDFPIRSRERAMVRAVLETKAFPFRLRLIPRILQLAGEYHLWQSVCYLFFNWYNFKSILADLVDYHLIGKIGPWLAPRLENNKAGRSMRVILKKTLNVVNRSLRGVSD